jgi:hypothetical protein
MDDMMLLVWSAMSLKDDDLGGAIRARKLVPRPRNDGGYAAMGLKTR